MTYAPERLHEEVAYIAYHFHWSRGEILDLEHLDRRRYLGHIVGFVNRANAAAEADG
ncbi:DUF6760 family protein [Actinomadura rupiterrae]|uniref:DUF6760 family protein n=1 Tax=Actinomadura rupiterrae TaxID=559627 RepID=UPI0020A5538F|nr:DUF6760 family protein [Actinomadura rupiterrae]MCP2342448.1 hypothetical protein [Actinomadura rupiterrae]